MSFSNIQLRNGDAKHKGIVMCARSNSKAYSQYCNLLMRRSRLELRLRLIRLLYKGDNHCETIVWLWSRRILAVRNTSAPSTA